MTKVSDYIANFFVEAGIKHVFMLTGGGAMHLNNSFGKHPKLEVVYNHHEQASAMAAESYARLCGRPAVVNVTTGPGGINTLNGVFGAWTDSIPMIVISGQVRYDTTIAYTGTHIRQLGDQEVDIVRMVDGITKYAQMVTRAEEIKYHLEKALYLATHGRPGPVWLDIPMNIQGSTVDETKLIGFEPEKEIKPIPTISPKTITEVIEKIKAAQRPVMLVGAGIRLSQKHAEFIKLVEQLKIPVTTAWNAHDALWDSHFYHAGKPGTIGDRAGNFAVQNADLLLVLGSRLNIRQISYNYQAFAREAYKIMVDIDELELVKPTLNIDQPIHGDLKDFIAKMNLALHSHPLIEKTDWLKWCRERKQKYPVVLSEYWKRDHLVNPYCFMKALSDALSENQIIVTGDGTACVISFQAIELKPEQRLYTNSGSASMGYDLPAAIGACIASGKQKVVCLAGDGSIQQNIQELAIIHYRQLPIKIFVLNNNGYHSIRQTQQNFFGEPMVGVGPESGLGFAEMSKLASAYEFKYLKCDQHHDLQSTIAEALSGNEPVICEIMLALDQQFAPKSSSKRLADGRMVTRPLEDMAPFLSREELASNMLIPMIPEE